MSIVEILKDIHGHEDLNRLTAEEQVLLCEEIRQFLISHVSKTGGHLASNLGVVELTVALETVFHTNNDRLVFDVGHQSYVHKLLTGRQADFDSLRQFGGIAGFPKPSESETDAFVAGHASNSVSIALGMARARTLLNQDYHVVAVLGDGAATGGMAYEGLNDAADSGEPMVIVLNDNEMSIDRNVGGMAKHLSKLRTKQRYLNTKESLQSFLNKVPFGKGIRRCIHWIKDHIKRAVLPTTIFQNMGLEYLGPVDGHDLPELIRILNIAKKMNRPVLVHVLTQKGHGYSHAELHPSKFHGIGKFDPNSGEVRKSGAMTFSDAFGAEMIRLAQENERICAITAAMPGGTGLLPFRERFPKRLFDVGIAEEHAVSMAGGLAKQGAIPVVALYSTFLQRTFDQIVQDVSIMRNHVVFAIDRAGLVGEDGETHHGVFDVGFLRQIPDMKILCPANCAELSAMLRWSVLEADGPVSLRYPRGTDRGFSSCAWTPDSTLCRHSVGQDVTLITYGAILDNVVSAAEYLKQNGRNAQILRLFSIKPLPISTILEQIPNHSTVCIVEEVMAGSGIAYELSAALAVKNCKVLSMDLGNEFVTHGSLPELYRVCGLDGEAIANRILEVCNREN